VIKITKLTDYGFIVLSRFAAQGSGPWQNAPDIARDTTLPLPTVSKILKLLTRKGLLLAHRGSKGGYALSRPSDTITAIDVIEALEGPVAITQCSCKDDDGEVCSLEGHCPTRSHWIGITEMIRSSLQRITLRDMVSPVASGAEQTVVTDGAGRQPCQCGHDCPDSARGCAGTTHNTTLIEDLK
jgi:FeS assembly SUF system regulator